jgi:uncharacterized Fe-S cluster protein YjdI
MSSKIREYTGEGIVVSYDVQRCIHAAECVRTLPQVFDPNRRPWINPQDASADDVAAAVQRCPTGALHFTRTDGGAPEPVPTENTITLEPNGPLYIRGNIELTDAQGTIVLHDTRVALCRCGASEIKPFCDGSHERVGFTTE